MKYVKYLLIGILFGIIMTKSEAISWYRIQEMFRFQAFHMYGIIGSALVVGVLIVQFIKRRRLKSIEGEVNFAGQWFYSFYCSNCKCLIRYFCLWFIKRYIATLSLKPICNDNVKLLVYLV